MSLILITIIAAIVSQALSWTWYGPIFGKKYRHSVDVSDSSMAHGHSKKWMIFALVANFIANLVMAFVFFNLLGAFGAFEMGAAIRTTAIVFIGFVLPLVVTGTIWNGRSTSSQKTTFAISLGYQIVNMLAWAILFSLMA